jgi:hypothetical protein
MPQFIKDYTKRVDLGDLGWFDLRELTQKEREGFDVQILQLQQEYGMLPEQSNIEKLEVLNNLLPEKQKKFKERKDAIETQQLLQSLVKWDDEGVPITEENVDLLPTFTRATLAAEIGFMSTGQDAVKAFFARYSVLPEGGVSSPVSQKIPPPPPI